MKTVERQEGNYEKTTVVGGPGGRMDCLGARSGSWRMEALEQGAQVELMFDAGAAWAQKVHKGQTDWGRYDLPDKLKELMAQQTRDDADAMPKTYQDLLKLFHERGAVLTINGTWNALTDVEKTIRGKENLPVYVQPLSLLEMLEHRAAADNYWSF
jgi:hypothetical protein